MQRSYSELQHEDDITALALPIYGLGRPTMSRAGWSPVGGWRWWTCGNGGFRDFHEAAENDFQPVWWKCKKSREAATCRFSRSFSRTWGQEWHVDMANDWSATLGEGAICGEGVPTHLAFGPIT
jgi:hypothetical protein